MDRKSLTQALLAKETGLYFVSIREAVDLHAKTIQEFGGTPGVRDVGLLESALHRPMMLAIERDERDPFVLSASVASAIVANRPFLDGNKRAAYLLSLRMLEKNGIIIDPDVAAAAEIFTDLAADKRTEEDLPAWLRQQVSCHSDDVKASTSL